MNNKIDNTSNVLEPHLWVMEEIARLTLYIKVLMFVHLK